MALITSSANPRIRSIRGLAHRKFRDETGQYFVEGIRPVAEAVQSHAPVETLVVAPDLLNSPFGRDIVQQASHKGVPILEVAPDVFLGLSSREGPQGLGAVVRQTWTPLEAAFSPDTLGWVALEQIQNPGNLGSILRTCEAVGCAGVMLLGSTTDPHDPASVRGSMGALFTRSLIRTGLDELTAWKTRHRALTVGASGSAETDYQDIAYRPPILIVMGGERQGLSEAHQALCDHLVRIPMTGRADSLNLAVATGLMLYEVFNQNRRRS
jgi:TrmH family RNA methyltransferase